MALVTPAVLVKLSELAERVMLGVPGGVVLPVEPPPQPVRRTRTEANRTAKKVLRSIRADPIESER